MNYSNHKIGLYIRVSTEEQAANPEGSIKSQEQRLREQAELGSYGKIERVYIDRAKSGGNTNREQLQFLLQDIQARKINLVMVTELSRLSRSVKDFTVMWELMNQMKCGFLSLREKFDTTTAAGEMLIMNLASFSQFERRQVSERVSANFLARAKRGLFNGGTIPLGYKHNPEKKGHLVIVEEEVPLVEKCFEVYLEKQTLMGAAQKLNELGFRLPRQRVGAGGQKRDGLFTIKNLSSIIKNQGFIGKRVYKEAGEEKFAAASWPAIIDESIFEEAQKLLDRNRKTKLKIQSKGNRYPYVLSSMVRCGTCGDSLVGKSAHGKSVKVAYYEHGNHLRRARKDKCNPFRVQAKILEPLVWKQIETLVSDKDFAKELFMQLQEKRGTDPFKGEFKGLMAQIGGLKRKISALTDHLTHVNVGAAAVAIYAEIQALSEKKAQSEMQVTELTQAREYRAESLSLKDFDRFLQNVRGLISKEMPVEEKAKVARLLLAKVEVNADHIKVYFNFDVSQLKSFEVTESLSQKRTWHSNQPTNLDKQIQKSPETNLFSSRGSFCLTNGGSDGT